MGWHSINGVQRQYFETKNSLWSWYKEENKFAVENQEILIKTFALLRQIRPFTSWQLSVPIFITKLAKEHLSQRDAGSLHCVNRRRLRRHVRTLGWGPWGPLDPWWNAQGRCRSVLFPVLELLPAGNSTPGLFWLLLPPIHLPPIESPLYFIAEKPIATYHHA